LARLVTGLGFSPFSTFSLAIFYFNGGYQKGVILMVELANENKMDVITQEEAENISAIWFEDDEEVCLRDGKTYKVPPSNLMDARKIMDLLKVINVDYIALNFVPSGNAELDNKRVEGLFTLLDIAFKPYGLSREYLDKYVDVVTARKICDILIGLNGIKK
jgi:hypothetical protein